MVVYGLTGNPLTHSWSKDYFDNLFIAKSLEGFTYELFPLAEAGMIPTLFRTIPALCGLNVTIPYKTGIIPYLDEIDPVARAIGAVNLVAADRTMDPVRLKGYNTDWIGFMESLPRDRTFRAALILGTGGAAKAVAYALQMRKIPFLFVSRNPSCPDAIGYRDISQALSIRTDLIINTTPAGMFPETGNAPPFPFQLMHAAQYAYDLIYNPPQTRFLSIAAEMGCKIQNGFEMLEIQAYESFRIWQEVHPPTGPDPYPFPLS